MLDRIQILDCTLRDGGYVNNWQFGEDGIDFILSKLQEAGVELIEAGFLNSKETATAGRTIYTSFEQVNKIAAIGNMQNVACMINYGTYPLQDIPQYEGKGVSTLRVAFHREELSEALDYCLGIKEKGYKTFVQPMSTMDYSQEELKLLLTRCNQFLPTAVYIVDTFGTMQQHDVLKLLQTYTASLDERIEIGFHSHNNLQLSFPNAQDILRSQVRHRIIIDSSVFGMGRGAGNLCTELLTMYLNEHYHASYQLVPILEIIDKYLNPIFIRTPWGYSMPYYVASINHCHPNYATFLMNKQTLGVRDINTILSQIPMDSRHAFDGILAERLYLEHQSCHKDDMETLHYLKNQLRGRKVLILAPGKTIVTHRQEITTFINQNNPLIMSVNFIPQDYDSDILFLSNTKRLDGMEGLDDKMVIATSNIPGNHFMPVDYTSLILPGKPESDNAGLMLLRLMQRMNMQEVYLAGFDGFTSDIHDNYCDDSLINSSVTEVFEARNKDVREQLSMIMQQMAVHFLTPSLYVR